LLKRRDRDGFVVQHSEWVFKVIQSIDQFSKYREKLCLSQRSGVKL
jgi:hypothetical protein